VVIVRAIKTLRDAGCPLQKVRAVKRLVEDSWGQALSGTFLYWNGQDVLDIASRGEVESTLVLPGQQVLHLVALPIHYWVTEAENLAHIQPVRRSRKVPKKQAGNQAAL
jgi:hypothetical protein